MTTESSARRQERSRASSGSRAGTAPDAAAVEVTVPVGAERVGVGVGAERVTLALTLCDAVLVAVPATLGVMDRVRVVVCVGLAA